MPLLIDQKENTVFLVLHLPMIIGPGGLRPQFQSICNPRYCKWSIMIATALKCRVDDGATFQQGRQPLGPTVFYEYFGLLDHLEAGSGGVHCDWGPGLQWPVNLVAVLDLGNLPKCHLDDLQARILFLGRRNLNKSSVEVVKEALTPYLGSPWEHLQEHALSAVKSNYDRAKAELGHKSNDLDSGKETKSVTSRLSRISKNSKSLRSSKKSEKSKRSSSMKGSSRKSSSQRKPSRKSSSQKEPSQEVLSQEEPSQEERSTLEILPRIRDVAERNILNLQGALKTSFATLAEGQYSPPTSDDSQTFSEHSLLLPIDQAVNDDYVGEEE
ncbi:hypothetical protein F5Y16DRAFT_29613 [Xylariaceae sp. FL0255]|nr:hypothetical protein F5Y16DRAFT_29613 [Xylariaceae sp. FL0255]